MAGHSKWANIKHRKGKQDAARGKTFTKLIREITVAAREGGGDESNNSRLRSAVLTAKSENMPAANIDRAIKKGIGELDGESYEAAIYEGYGPGGVAMFVDALTDNKNRTVSEVRHLFNKHNGSMAESGAVAWVFEQKGLIVVPKEGVEEDDLMLVALDAGAEDIVEEEDTFEVFTPVSETDVVRKAIEEADISIERSELTRIPQNSVEIEGKTAQQLLTLMEMLEDNDDVQRVYANFDISDEELATLTA
ncbi:MAG: YebC/PmpR family DNA-binding transcriptional regulator [Candidatus Latescibacteria bacterium]|jgi:YebC/PmpR family DNA-binding regulatory protein|nr:YebC/PmpR family DNA-binding transcriptional regulator [Candidatus Latescibacterota bacterium]MBT4137243.1 YebC/PmpR family DNA-binding transcriptional regulator [Candidatus Latescibacterota bacterium]